MLDVDAEQVDRDIAAARQPQLQERLEQLTQRRAPADATTAVARLFIESWRGMADLLPEATAEEMATLVQHLVEVIELRPAEGSSSEGV
jgi:hypothetical protein